MQDQATFLLINRTTGPSHKTGGTYWRFRWFNTETCEEFDTTVDSTMRNFRLWQHLIQDPNPWGVYVGLQSTSRSTTQHRAVITADHVPECLDKADDQSQMQQIKNICINRNQPTNQFSSLFE